MILVNELQAQYVIYLFWYAFWTSGGNMPTGEPMEHHRDFPSAARPRAAVSIMGPNKIVRIRPVEYKTCAERGQLGRQCTRRIESQWAHVEEELKSLRGVSVDCNDASKQLPLWHYRRSLTTVSDALQRIGVFRLHHSTPRTQHTVASMSISNFATRRMRTSCSF